MIPCNPLPASRPCSGCPHLAERKADIRLGLAIQRAKDANNCAKIIDADELQKHRFDLRREK